MNLCLTITAQPRSTSSQSSCTLSHQRTSKIILVPLSRSSKVETRVSPSRYPSSHTQGSSFSPIAGMSREEMLQSHWDQMIHTSASKHTFARHIRKRKLSKKIFESSLADLGMFQSLALALLNSHYRTWQKLIDCFPLIKWKYSLVFLQEEF